LEGRSWRAIVCIAMQYHSLMDKNMHCGEEQ